MLFPQWTSSDYGWHRLQDVQPADIDVVGIYMIWYVGNPGAVITVGQGHIGRLLSFDQNSKTLLSMAPAENIYVSWAEVPADQRDGITRYLANVFEPRIGGSFPIATPVETLAPWECGIEFAPAPKSNAIAATEVANTATQEANREAAPDQDETTKVAASTTSWIGSSDLDDEDDPYLKAAGF